MVDGELFEAVLRVADRLRLRRLEAVLSAVHADGCRISTFEHRRSVGRRAARLVIPSFVHPLFD